MIAYYQKLCQKQKKATQKSDFYLDNVKKNLIFLSGNQFEIVWQASGNTKASAPKEILEKLNYIRHKEDRGGCGVINGKRKYDRLFIKKVS